MEAILSDDLLLESGAFVGALALLVLVLGSVLLGRLADREKTGKRFFWAEWPFPGAEPGVTEERGISRAAWGEQTDHECWGAPRGSASAFVYLPACGEAVPR
ncbi:MAG TPA: hypothetical protein VFW15_12780 [Thermoanaerobaculia bacterium]|nr:hypothetical protein [Thermoanaerobaculia bacterium]